MSDYKPSAPSHFGMLMALFCVMLLAGLAVVGVWVAWGKPEYEILLIALIPGMYATYHISKAWAALWHQKQIIDGACTIMSTQKKRIAELEKQGSRVGQQSSVTSSP